MFYVRLPEDDLKKVETRWSVSRQLCEVYILVLVNLWVLTITLFINVRI
jgi:hypothetical protein